MLPVQSRLHDQVGEPQTGERHIISRHRTALESEQTKYVPHKLNIWEYAEVYETISYEIMIGISSQENKYMHTHTHMHTIKHTSTGYWTAESPFSSSLRRLKAGTSPASCRLFSCSLPRMQQRESCGRRARIRENFSGVWGKCVVV